MNPQIRQILVAIAAGVAAVWLGFQIAEGRYFWPAIAVTLALGAGLTRLLRLPFDVILTGLALFGYLVGNRGFAQLMPAPGLPLLPAETVLLVAGTWRGIVWAHSRQLPFARDSLNHILLAWLVLGGGRFALDLPRHGFLAVRDFAMVYYAVFFFLVQHMARDPKARRWLLGCLLGGTALLPFTFGASELFPRLFLSVLTIHEVPLIYFKGDLAFTYFGVASLLWYFVVRGSWRGLAVTMSVALVLWILASDNRASLLGVACATTLLLLAGRWRYPLTLGVASGLAALALLGMAALGNNAWAHGKLRSTADRISSITDFAGQGSYMSGENFYKGDNNRFRATWWKNVILETWDSNPVLGLGFGHDLAGGFLQEYYPDGTAEDFAARSPHNIFITVFGRMGLLGLAVWVGFCWILLRRTWHSLQTSAAESEWAIWCGLWVLLVSATFGVVLEGPMGAVPFWVMLGLVSAKEAEIAESSKAALPLGDETASA
jgi:O-antigen ligase